MRTLLIIVGGLALLGLFLFVGRRIGGTDAAALIRSAQAFIPVWLVVGLLNMWMGVARDGYSVAEEFPIFLAIFAIPASVAVFAWWKAS